MTMELKKKKKKYEAETSGFGPLHKELGNTTPVLRTRTNLNKVNNASQIHQRINVAGQTAALKTRMTEGWTQRIPACQVQKLTAGDSTGRNGILFSLTEACPQEKLILPEPN